MNQNQNPDDYEAPMDLPERVEKSKPQPWEMIGEAFTKAYYNTFDKSRQDTAKFYRNDALMTYQNSKVMGKANILQKLNSLHFSQISHKVVYEDYQPDPRTVKSPNGMEIYVVCSGVLYIKEDKQQFSFCDFFHLVPEGKSFFIMNHIFQLTHSGESIG